MIIIAGRVHVDPRDATEFITDAKATYPRRGDPGTTHSPPLAQWPEGGSKQPVST
ncbi:hypothetical protein [Streptomyces sp. NBRC 110028]|uniref:hypothetical protein n=1 Tax=Streptomyces sp. NBRC 110028 TaxID=1621260 RepID=UPI00131CD199|nr:hypothetical protein [Streptomyces sp. NBRC 110028]